MNFNIPATTPLKLFEGTLAVLAETIGGYKDDGTEFLEVIADLTDAHDPVVIEDAVDKFRAFVNALRGADNLMANLAEQTAEGQTPPVTAEEEGVDFIDPNEIDLATGLFGAGSTITGGELFTLPGGPGGLGEVLAKMALDATREADTAPSNDVPAGLEARLEALLGKGNFKIIPLGTIRAA